MEDKMSEKSQAVINGFSRSVEYYHDHADLQKQTAERLARALEPWRYSIPEGPILEVGAGTGFFTKHLLNFYPSREAIITDASEQMVKFNKKKTKAGSDCQFRVFNPDTENVDKEKYALVCGNFVAHWFQDISGTLSTLAESLKPGGIMLMSFPGNQSFQSWWKYCLELGIPFTANNLPDIEKVVVNLSMGPFQVDFYEDQATENYPSLRDFFNHLKKTGMGTRLSGKPLSYKQFKLLDRHWREQGHGKITIDYHMAFLAVKRDL